MDMIRRWFQRRIDSALFPSVHALPLSLIIRWQERRLRILIKQVGRYVPLYQDLLRKSGLTVDDILSLDDLRKLPLLDKASFMGKPIEEYVNSSRGIPLLWRTTSGTSGRPFSIAPNSTFANPYSYEFCLYRFLWKHGRPTRNLSQLRIARIKIRSSQRENRLFISVRDYLTDTKRVVAELAEFQPDILESYSSILLDLARWMVREGRVAEFKPTYIVSFGEMLTPAARTLVTRVFSAEIFDRYGAEEVGSIAVECSAHDGMHVNSESVIVEIVDDEGRPVPHGSRGRIIVTDLFNFNMPFIRYDTGDRGVLLTSPCPCGLQTPRIRIEGRYSAYLEFGAQRIHHLEFDGALDAFANHIEQYQVVKIAEDALEIRIVPAPAFTEASRLRAKDSVTKLTGPNVSVGVVTVIQIEPTEHGKSQIVLDLTVKR